MPQFSNLPRAVLLSISALSGASYRDVGFDELKAELARPNFTPTDSALVGAMEALKDAGYLEAYFTAGDAAHLIRLAHAGRQEVEGWPVAPGSLSASDVEALLATLDAHSDDAAVPEHERGRARAAAAALRDLGVSVTAEIIGAWLKSMGVG